MAVKYKRSLMIIGTSIIAALCFFMFYLGYRNFLEPKLGEFTILDLKEENSTLTLFLSECHNAIKYEVKISNQSGEEVFLKEANQPIIELTNLTANYGDTLKIQVTAKNKNGTKKDANLIYSYDWKSASFVNLKSHYITDNSGLNLQLYGYLPNETYHLKLEYLNDVIFEEEVLDSNIFIESEKINGYAGRITAKLYNVSNRLISTYNFYINTPVIGKIKILTPEENFRTRWNDISLSWSGGENATEYRLFFYRNGIYDMDVIIPSENQKYNIPANYLKEESDYKLVLKAMYKDYEEISETAEVNLYVSKKETTNPVYVNHNPSFIKSGTNITLSSRTANAKIYYTTDGTEPTINSKLYKNPISIQEDTTIKTFAITSNRYDSAINTYDFKIKEKDLVVYLSPSNQYMNYGVQSVGFTTEMQMMNKIADVVGRVLKENGVKVYRNTPSGNINVWLSESNYVKSDLHLAIHSNASSKKEARGIEIYIDKPTSKSLSIASNIYKNLYDIYPGKGLSNTDRGVKYAEGSLGEANDSFIPCGTLIEVAYHDNLEDARWIAENIENIGKNIAQSILTYYN